MLGLAEGLSLISPSALEFLDRDTQNKRVCFEQLIVCLWRDGGECLGERFGSRKEVGTESYEDVNK